MPYEEDYKMWLEKALIGMNPDWVCDEMSDNEFTHNWCHQYCGEDDAYITPKCLHMYYHHIARADRKTELNNCEDYKLFDREALILLIECQKERIAELLAKTEPHHSGEVTEMVEPQTCRNCKWSQTVCRLGDNPPCHSYEPKTEPLDKDINVRSKEPKTEQTEVTTDCRQTNMTLDDAYYLVYKDLTKEDGLLTGKYDAKNGSKQFMNGVWTVMELLAYGVGIDCYEAFNEWFCRNLEKSQEQAKEPQTERSE